ncbi:MAG: thioredoxin family protein [Streptococcaceae bacterium]|nr:thioredoxin family protein [Streptococcaceae bacterium]
MKNKKITLISSLLLILLLFIFATKSMTQTKEELVLIDNQQLENVIKSKKETIVYIGRPTCPQCQEFEPTLRKVLKEEKIHLDYYNTDEARKQDESVLSDLTTQLGVNTVPTVAKLKNGIVVNKIVGVKNEQAIKEFLGEK